jgi:hypothetical protein
MEGQDGVYVDVELTSDELGTLMRALEARELRVDDFLHALLEHGLVGLVKLPALTESAFLLAGVPSRVVAERRQFSGPLV